MIGMMTTLIPVPMIIGNPATGSSTAGMNPIDPVELASITIGMIIFLFFAVTISYSSHKRKKEMEAQVAEWKRGEQERRRKFRDRFSELGESEQTA
jgi:hypothetical protein